MTVSMLSPWQGDDGFPTDAYFEAVAEQLRWYGFEVIGWEREDHSVATFHLEPGKPHGRMYGDADDLALEWSCDPYDEPKTGGFSGLGWRQLLEWHLPDGGTRGIARALAVHLAVHPVADPSVVVETLLGWMPLLPPEAGRG